MTGPKHLWSGDWENDSARTAEELANAPRPVFDAEPEQEPPPTASRRWSRRQLVIALTTGVAAAAVTVGLVAALAGSSTPHAPRHHSTATTPATAQAQRPTGGRAPANVCQQNPTACTRATPVVSGPTADWLGMQIVTSPGGIVINTIRLGSEPDQVGFEPGDEIEQIDGHPITSIEQIRQVTDRIALGKQVRIEVLRASAITQLASMPMTERPTIHP